MRMTRKLYRNTIANYATTILPIVVGFFLMPFIVHHLGQSAFGIWALVIALTGYFGFLDLGFTATVVKEISEYIAKKDREQVNIISSTMLILYCGLGLFALIGFFAIGRFFLATWFNIPENLEDTTRIATYILGIQVGISFPFRLFDGMVQGMQDFRFRAIIVTFTTILRTILILIFLSRGYGLIALVIINFLSAIPRWYGNLIYVLKKLPYLSIHFSKFHWAHARSLLGFSSQMFILQTCALLILGTDKIIIGIFLPIAAVTMYEVGLKIHNVIRSLTANIQAVVLPAASELDAKSDKEGLQQLMLRGSKYVLIIYFFLAIPAIILGKPFIRWWIGKEFITASSILVVLMVGQMFNALNFVSGQIFKGIGKLKVYTLVRVASTVLNVGLSIVLLQAVGLVGVALATAIQFVLSDIFLLYYFLTQLEIAKKQYLAKCILTTFPFAIISGLALFSYTHFIDVNSFSIMMLGGIIHLLIFGLLIFRFGLNIRERNSINLLLHKTLHMPSKIEVIKYSRDFIGSNSRDQH